MQLGFVASVVEAAARVDLDVLLSPSGGDHDRSFERIISGRRVDGVILMEIRLEDAAPEAPPRHLLLAPPVSLRSSTGPVPGGR
ncbi:MAG TPA: hypothetical protein VJT31_07285 [Rugosimonospora sp.]|nr:hypothetical protein [Rugosimonospora sp.]